MSIYMSRLFQRSNSSFLLCGGTTLKSKVVRVRDDTYLVDSGPGAAKICMEDELTGEPNRRGTRFETKVGFSVDRNPPIQDMNLERLFIDIVVGDSVFRERSAARFKAMVGSIDAVPGEPHLILPRRFRQRQAWRELNKIWRTNAKVRGFFVEKVRGGYAVAIAGFVTFLPMRPNIYQRILNDRFTIESFNPKRKSVVVF